jgi:hypothetical protein
MPLIAPFDLLEVSAAAEAVTVPDTEALLALAAETSFPVALAVVDPVAALELAESVELAEAVLLADSVLLDEPV